jgi:hypothetical protein
MAVSYVLFFAAFAALQAALTVKLADVLSPTVETGRRTAEPLRGVGAAKLV